MTEVDANDQELSFLEHLVELRGRLLKACSAVLIVLVILLPFHANSMPCWQRR